MFGVMDGIGKLLATDFPLPQLVWARYAFAVPVILATTAPKGWLSLLRCERPLLQAARGLLPLLASATVLLGLRLMSLADATAISFAAPLFVVILSVPLLRERVGASAWVGVGVGFLGVLIVARPGAGSIAWAALLPLATAFLFGLYQVLTRLASRGDPAATTLTWTILTGFLLTTPLLPLGWANGSLAGWLLLILSGLLFGTGQLLLIRAFVAAPAAISRPSATRRSWRPCCSVCWSSASYPIPGRSPGSRSSYSPGLRLAPGQMRRTRWVYRVTPSQGQASRADHDGERARLADLNPTAVAIASLSRVRKSPADHSLDRRQISFEAFHLHGRQLPGAALRQVGGADIRREDVGVSMDAERAILLGIGGIVPGAGGKLDHARADAVREAHAGEAGAAGVEEADDVAVANAPRLRILGMHARDFAAAVLGIGAVVAEIELAVQAGRRLVGDQEEGGRCTRLVCRREPGGMAGTIRLAKTGDGLGEDFDLAAGGRQRMGRGIVVESPEAAAVIGLLREIHGAERPEFVEAGGGETLRRETGARRLVEIFQPLADAAALRESIMPAEPLGQAGEDRVIVAGLTMRLGHSVHRDQQGIVGVAPDILALQGHGARQHEVRMPCRRRPGQLVNDQRVDLPKARRRRARS